MAQDEHDACCDMPAMPDDPRRVTQPNKRALVNRLRRIEGQVAGVRSMVESDRYCVDILTQISAAKSALDGVAIEVLSSHANGCVRRAVSDEGGQAAIDELLGVIRKMIR